MTELIQPNALSESRREYRINRRWLILVLSVGGMLLLGAVLLCSVISDERVQLLIIVIGMVFFGLCLLASGTLYYVGMREAKENMRTLMGPGPITRAELGKNMLGAVMVAISLTYAIFWLIWWLVTIVAVGQFDEIAWTWTALAVAAIGLSGWVVLQALGYIWAHASRALRRIVANILMLFR